MKKDDNTTNYSARLVCEKCGYVFGLKETAFVEHGFNDEPWNSNKKEVLCYNEIYPKVCPRCKREAQHISYGVKLDVYCARTADEADAAKNKRIKEDIRNGIEKLKEINKLKKYQPTSPENMTKILSYCNADVNLPKCVDCDAVKDYCSVCKDCPHKDTLPADYFEKNGLYPCAVFPTLKNASDFANYLMERLKHNCVDYISLATVSNSVRRYNGFIRLHKTFCGGGSDKSIPMIKTNEGCCGWFKDELKTYGVGIDFEENPQTDDRVFCVYLPIPKYFQQ